MTGEFNEKLAELIEAHKEMKRKKQANKVQITNKLEKINQYNDSINEIIKSIALDSEQLVELNIENVNTKIDELKSLDEENKNLQKQHDEICKEKDQLLEENNELKEQVVTLEGNTNELKITMKEKEKELIDLKTEYNKNKSRASAMGKDGERCSFKRIWKPCPARSWKHFSWNG